MNQNKLILNIIIDRAISNTQGCINNITDINRASTVGEKAWHIYKYTVPLNNDKKNLEEDIQLLFNIASNSKVTIFGSSKDYQHLDKLVKTWNQIEQAKVVPYKKIKEILEQLKK